MTTAKHKDTAFKKKELELKELDLRTLTHGNGVGILMGPDDVIDLVVCMVAENGL